MLKVNKHIEIVRSTDTWLSSMSQVSCDAIFEVLNKTYSKVGISIVNNHNDLRHLVETKPDLVFLGMKFIPDENTIYSQHSDKIWLADYFDKNDIAYTGSTGLAHGLELDKSLAKQRVLEKTLSTSPFFVVKQDLGFFEDSLPSYLNFPLFVKPTNRGGGLGIDSNSVVNNLYELEAKVNSIALKLQSDSLVEKYLIGREFSVAILKNIDSDKLIAMPLELIAQPDRYGSRILSGKVKSLDEEKVFVIEDSILRSKICNFALEVFSAIGARDYGRIDIRLDETGEPQFLEANLIPSLIDNYGSFPKACHLNLNLGYSAMIIRITNLGLERSYRKKILPELDDIAGILLPPKEVLNIA